MSLILLCYIITGHQNSSFIRIQIIYFTCFIDFNWLYIVFLNFDKCFLWTCDFRSAFCFTSHLQILQGYCKTNIIFESLSITYFIADYQPSLTINITHNDDAKTSEENLTDNSDQWPGYEQQHHPSWELENRYVDI